MKSDTATNDNCVRCGGNLIHRSDEKNYYYLSCIQCGCTKELGYDVCTPSKFVKKMNRHPDGLGGYIRGLLK